MKDTGTTWYKDWQFYTLVVLGLIPALMVIVVAFGLFKKFCEWAFF